MTRFAFVLAATLAIMFAAGPGHARDGAAAHGPGGDGDTIEVDGQAVDPPEIDAPEPGRCANSAGFDWSTMGCLVARLTTTCA